MPISTPKHQFTVSHINAYAPHTRGVYALYDNGQVVYYGKSNYSVRDRLLSHKAGNEGRCTQHAALFNTEYATNPEARERQLLREHYAKHGKLPRCNERVG